MGGNTGPVIQDRKHYKLGWGQLNDQGNVDSTIHFTNLQLDIVGFLAILGEGSVLASSSVATLSKVIFLPRLLPAPQALLRPSRPDKLPSSKGWAIGVHSGNDRDYVNFIGHTLADAERLPEYSVKCIEIKRIRNTGVVKAKLLGPTTFVAILGFILSMGLLGFSLWQQDGMGMLAVLCLSFLSTLIGVGNKWTLNLPTRRNAGQFTPKGDVVIRYPKGNFVVVRCTEDVARELFFAPETIEYLVEHPWKYRMIALVGTIILMFGVIFLGNSGTYVQVTFAGAFMVLNAGYWIVAALPQRYHWDTRCFEVIPQAFDEPAQPPVKEIYDSKTDHCKLDDKDIDSKKAPKLRVSKSLPIKRKPWVSYNKTFTQALWKVIVATQDIEWARRSKTAPATDAWDEWLHEALAQASCMPPEPKLQKQLDGSTVAFYQMPEWNAQKALSQCLQAHANDTEKGNKRFDRNSADTANTMAGAEAGVEAKDQAHSTSLEV